MADMPPPGLKPTLKPSDISQESFTVEAVSVVRYYGKVLYRAGKETRQCFELTRRAILVGAAIYFLSVLLGTIILSPDKIFQEIPGFITWLLGLGIFIVALFGVNLIRAPHLIDREQVTRIQGLEEAQAAEIDIAHLLHRLALLHHEGQVYFLAAKHGQQLVSEDDIMDWARRVHPILREWKGLACQSEFIYCTEKLPFDEKYASSVRHRKRCGFLHPRLEMIMREMKEMEKNHYLSRALIMSASEQFPQSPNMSRQS